MDKLCDVSLGEVPDMGIVPGSKGLNIFNTLIFKKVSSINTLLQFTNIILVCWFISRVNLTGQRDAQTTGKTLFLNVSVRVFPEEMSI